MTSILPIPQLSTTMERLDALEQAQLEQVLEDYIAGTPRRTIATGLGVGFHVFEKWIQSRPEIMRLFDEAKKLRAEALGDETLEIADTAGSMPGEAAVAAVRIKARHWLAERLDPERFGRQAKGGISIGALHLHAVKEINEKETQARIAHMEAQREPLPAEIVEGEDIDAEETSGVEADML